MMKFLKAKINGTNLLVAALAVLLTVAVLGGCAGASRPTEPSNETVPMTLPNATLVATEPSPTEAPGTEPPETEPAQNTGTNVSFDKTPATKPPATEPPATAPVATTPAKPTTLPATKPPATEPSVTKPAETQPAAPQTPVYACGVEGHICKNEAYHSALMAYINDGCPHCGSSDCPCLLSIDIDGCTWPNYSQCPQYDKHKDPTLYCQDCGLIWANHAQSGQEGCIHANRDTKCPWCKEAIAAGECHHCTKP